jgi:hypothetical protein
MGDAHAEAARDCRPAPLSCSSLRVVIVDALCWLGESSQTFVHRIQFRPFLVVGFLHGSLLCSLTFRGRAQRLLRRDVPNWPWTLVQLCTRGRRWTGSVVMMLRARSDAHQQRGEQRGTYLVTYLVRSSESEQICMSEAESGERLRCGFARFGREIKRLEPHARFRKSLSLLKLSSPPLRISLHQSSKQRPDHHLAIGLAVVFDPCPEIAPDHLFCSPQSGPRVKRVPVGLSSC